LVVANQLLDWISVTMGAAGMKLRILVVAIRFQETVHTEAAPDHQRPARHLQYTANHATIAEPPGGAPAVRRESTRVAIPHTGLDGHR
jgi:hypothetical protein